MILFLHGGAYVLDLAFIHWRMIEGLIDRTGATVIVPIYPLAPLAGWNEIYGMIRAVYQRLLHTHDPMSLTIMGDSAGGGLTLATAVALRDQGVPLPARLILPSPWLDVTDSDPEQLALDRRDPLLGLRGLRAAGLAYSANIAPTDPRVSPLFSSLIGLPPILLLTGTRDLLNTDAHQLREKAQVEGVNLRFREFEGMIHDWMALPTPEARIALDEIAAFLA